VEQVRPLLIFLTETHIVEAEAFDQYYLPGYSVAFCLSHSRHTGGVAIYARNFIKFSIQLCESAENNWVLGILVEHGIKAGKYALLYHSPNSSDSRFIQILENWLETFLDHSKFNLVAGDFNIDWFNEQDSNNLKQLTIFFNLRQTAHEYTRITSTSRTLVDHVFSNFDTVVSLTDAKSKITDHETVFINFDENNNLDNKVKVKCWKKYSKEALSGLVRRSLEFQSVTNDLDQKAAVLTDVLKTSTSQLVSEKFVDLDNSNSWYTLDLLRLKHKRNNLYIKCNRTNSSSDWHNYSVTRNKYSQLLRKTRSEYIRNKIDQHKDNSKELWKILKNLMKSANHTPRSITFDGREVQSEQTIADKFNNYFVDSVSLINQSIELVTEPEEIKQPIANNCKLDIFQPVTFAEMKEICFSLEKSAGVDNVGAKVIQDCFDVIGHSLVDLINESLQTGHVPQVWKESLVVPIQKIAGTNKCEEFRPINMLHTLEKILEIVVKGQLVAYLNQNHLLIPEQSGYREQHSCETALNLVLAKWKESIENKETIFAVFLDLKRAFETISRPLLLQCLKRFGIEGGVYKWFESYLSNRTQRTTFLTILLAPLVTTLVYHKEVY